MNTEVIYASQGSGTIGHLKGNVLHMNRVYETHHFRKTPGWGIDKQSLEDNLHRIRAIVIHCERTVKGQKMNELLTFTIDFEKHMLKRGSKELIFDTINFGSHGTQYVIPDAYWKTEISSVANAENFEASSFTEVPKTNKELEPLTLASLDYDYGSIIVQDGMPYVQKKQVDYPELDLGYGKKEVDKPDSLPLLNLLEAYPLIKKGYKVYATSMGEGFYLSLSGNTLMVHHEQVPLNTPFNVENRFFVEELFLLKP